jgi:hypothetical protein
MKKHSFILSIALASMLFSCNSAQNDAAKQAEQIQSEIKENTPGSISTTADGYNMKAKINGKEWVADAMMPPDAAGRIIGYFNGESIGLPYDRRYLEAGKKITFSENEAVDLMTNDDVGIWGGRKGEMQITKVDDKFAEGTFFFTGSTSRSDKTIEVTDGSFRIPISDK